MLHRLLIKLERKIDEILLHLFYAFKWFTVKSNFDLSKDYENIIGEKLKSKIEQASIMGEETILSNIDQNDFFFATSSDLRLGLSLPPKDFAKRKRYEVQLVALPNGSLAIKKNYSSVINFMREIRALNQLSNKCNIPKLLKIDYSQLNLYMTYINGVNLRQSLFAQGSKILDIHPQEKEQKYTREEKWIYRLREGRKNIFNVITKETRKNIFNQYKIILSNGILTNDIKYGNLILCDDTPFIIDFERSIKKSFFSTKYFEDKLKKELKNLVLHYIPET
tara:strand:+ start:6581 stop:7417 length:837 start_codon:yes stop_codon:yes gene_type:complete